MPEVSAPIGSRWRPEQLQRAPLARLHRRSRASKSALQDAELLTAAAHRDAVVMSQGYLVRRGEHVEPHTGYYARRRPLESPPRTRDDCDDIYTRKKLWYRIPHGQYSSAPELQRVKEKEKEKNSRRVLVQEQSKAIVKSRSPHRLTEIASPDDKTRVSECRPLSPENDGRRQHEQRQSSRHTAEDCDDGSREIAHPDRPTQVVPSRAVHHAREILKPDDKTRVNQSRPASPEKERKTRQQQESKQTSRHAVEENKDARRELIYPDRSGSITRPSVSSRSVSFSQSCTFSPSSAGPTTSSTYNRHGEEDQRPMTRIHPISPSPTPPQSTSSTRSRHDPDPIPFAPPPSQTQTQRHGSNSHTATHPAVASDEDLRILIVGSTGAGKSTLISRLTDHNHAPTIGHTLMSCTSEISKYPCQLDGQRFTLVDSAGFDDNRMSDTAVLAKLAQYLLNGPKIHGIIFCHRISDTRLTGSAAKTAQIIHSLIRPGFQGRVALVSTMWDRVRDKKVALRRECELLEHERFWGMFRNPKMGAPASSFRFALEKERSGGLINAVEDIVQHFFDMQRDGLIRGPMEMRVPTKQLQSDPREMKAMQGQRELKALPQRERAVDTFAPREGRRDCRRASMSEERYWRRSSDPSYYQRAYAVR